jgi:hypothetical protein
MRLFQRFENNLTKGTSGEYGIVVYDGQRSQHYTMAHRLLRRMQVFNPVPSMGAAGYAAGTYRMMPVTRILGDPVIRDSREDVFLQMADVMAYALLRKDNPPTHPVSVRYSVAQMFDVLTSVWLRQAHGPDPQGVVRA